jgi:hypothetical protein
MKTKLIAILGILALLAAIVPTALAETPPIDYKPVDIGPELRTWEATPERIQGGFTGFTAEELDALEAQAMAAASGTPYFDCILDAKVWLSLDNYDGFYFFDTFYQVATTDGSEMWVQADLTYPEGDPRDDPMVTCEQAAYLLGEFDNNMYPVETSFFGTPDFHGGANSLLVAWGYFPPGYYDDADGRQVVLVSNVIDDNYYDPTYPNYIAGFYSPTFEAYFDRNIMNIDSHDWENRVGPDGSRPYLYEGVFAHEYQHLLHDDYDPGEVELVNEGLAMFAEFLTGYVVGNDAYSTFEALPENSLPVWEDQGGPEIVADYGMVFLYQMYLYENFGQEFIQYEFHNQDHGIASINSTLAAFNIQKDFGDLYHDFSVAVLVDSRKANYRYGFKTLDVGIDIGTPSEPNPDAYDTPGAPPWGADYIWIEGKPKDLAKFTFNGMDYTTFQTAWTSEDGMLFSGTGDLLDNWAIFETTGGGELSIDTLWDLEDYWDFAFVQVSTDGGYTWTSLEDNEGYSTYDVDPNAISTAVENLPGLTSWVPDFVTLSYDLSPYAGQDILVAFRLVTDWATHYGGWWIDAVYMDGVEIFDGSDASVFKDITEVVPINNDFTVTFVAMRGNRFKVHTIKLSEVNEEGMFELDKILNWSREAVMIVTFDAPEGFTGYADYTYDFTYTNAGPK